MVANEPALPDLLGTEAVDCVFELSCRFEGGIMTAQGQTFPIVSSSPTPVDSLSALKRMWTAECTIGGHEELPIRIAG